ncbi:MAG: response regulator [Ruminiclostridium sp.]
MIKLLIAEDEYVVRHGIVSSIDWESLGIEVCGEAENGAVALEMAKRLKPHIILTDIKMPVMDGLEFVSNLKISQPNVKVIVFSGYDDFSYAMRAIRLGVNEYLLKPINVDELIRVITEQKNNIIDKLNQLSKKYYIDPLHPKSLPQMQFSYLMRLLSSASINKTILAQATSLGINLQGPEHKVIVVDIDDYIFQEEQWTDSERDTMKIAIMNIIEDVFNGLWEPTICYGKYGYLIILLSGKAILDEIVEDMCSQMMEFVGKYISISLTVGIGSTCTGEDDLGRSYNEARTAIKSKSIVGKNRIIKSEDVEDINSNLRLISNYGYEKELVSAIRNLDINNIQEALEKVLTKYDNNMLHFEMVKVECIKLLVTVAGLIEDVGINVNKAYGGYFNPVEKIDKLESIETCTEYVRNEILNLIGIVSREKSENYRAIVKKTIDYIKEKYVSDINLEDVAKELFITSSYLSRVFKKETGVNFVTWVNKYRVERAKELLKDMSLKTYHIAELVGYNDYRYFNINFKKYSGYTAKEYREKISRNQGE